MKNKHSKNSRTLSIYIRLCAGKLINKAEEANRFGVDERSIQRDIDDIRAFLEDQKTERSTESREIIYDRVHKGFTMTGTDTLYDVLNEMGYRPKAKKIGKDSDKDGWRIEGRTMAGDVFNVDRIFTDDAGNTHIQVNEQVEGTCQNATKEFSQKAAKKGLIFERFTMENGTVVADRTERKTAQKSAVNSQIIGRVRM